jgi:3-methyladenine DNA glycosylase/8-oxoguanine DNA glycosylase
MAMLLNDDLCYRAMKARDPRFDGRFFVAVSSTRIYCRPVCPANPPKRENCHFYPDIASAEATGYRACLRCRPNVLPGGIPDDAGDGFRLKRRYKSTDNYAFDLPYREPYDWRAMLAFLNARAVQGVEEVGGSSYRRTVRVSRNGRDHLGWIDVSPVEGKPALRVIASPSLSDVLPAIAARIKRLLDVSSNPLEIAAALGRIAKSNPGLRVPGAFDGFEIGVRAILGQQVTVAAARTVAGRFAKAFGTSIESPYPSLTMAFPPAQKIAELTVDHIARLGILAARSRSIIALAKAIADGSIHLGPATDVGSEIEKLRALPGIGEWTSQYIAMRALSWPDAFPHTDYGVMKALAEKDPKRVLKTAEQWRPWRSYAVMHLWHSLHQQKSFSRREKVARRAPDEGQRNQHEGRLALVRGARQSTEVTQ